MTIRHLYLARHGAADTFGELTDVGRRQIDLLGARLAALPIDVVWHSPLPRATASAHELAEHLPGAPVIEAPELTDHVPYVPPTDQTPPDWLGFFDGYNDTEAAAGRQTADHLTRRFGGLTISDAARTPNDTHEILITHAYPSPGSSDTPLDAPPARWLGLDSANAALTLIEHRTGLPPTLITFNEMSHLPPDLRWTGFPNAARP